MGISCPIPVYPATLVRNNNDGSVVAMRDEAGNDFDKVFKSQFLFDEYHQTLNAMVPCFSGLQEIRSR
jgi:hypothetical protein